MRALFTMFAEDVELLPKDSFVNLLKSLHGHTDQFVPMIEELWGRMKTGGFSTVLREKVRHFNSGLFEHATALPLTDDQFELLIEASRADWRDVEPAILGTLLERALNPIERHKLGAHYTPRAYVERLVMPTVVEPLRAEWDAAYELAVVTRGIRQPLQESRGFERLLNSYNEAAPVAPQASDVRNHELHLHWLAQATPEEAAETQQGHGPDHYAQQLVSLLRRCGA